MTVVLVDSNVILDVFEEDTAWFGWSSEALAAAANAGALVINPIVYAEASIRFTDIAELEAAFARTIIEREEIPYEAAFLAGKVFLAYRRRGGRRTMVLPDFFIGAHAAVRGYRLLTRDVRRYRAYFPDLPLIAPA